MTQTQTLDIAEVLDIATENGSRPFAAWVKVTENSHGGIDIANANSGETFRVAVDDGRVALHVFTGGRAMLLAGSQEFSGSFARPVFVASALADLL